MEAVCGVLEDVPYAVKQVGAFVVPGAEQLHLIQRSSHLSGCFFFQGLNQQKLKNRN